MCQGVHREVFPYRWRGDLCVPAEGEVDRGEAYLRCLEESWALKEDRKGKDCGSLAEAGLAFGGAQATLRAARRLLYLQ